MKQLHIKDLGPRQLWKLRKEVCVNSLFLSDYENSFGIKEEEVCDFFNGYLDFLEEEMIEDHKDYTDDMFWDLFNKYDTYHNVNEWAACIEW